VLKEQTPNPYYNDKNGKLKQSSEYNDYLNFLRLFIFSDNHSSVQTYGDTIITFNYDLVLEATATIYNRNRAEKGKNIGFAFNTMFGKSNIVSDDINRYFIKNGQHDFFPAIDIFSEEASAINLIKLHGSINWKLNNDNNKTFIVPPTWNKSDTEIRKLWNLAYEELTKAKRIIIIGYSFPEIDIYVKSLIALALNENSIIQNIYFINPDSENAKKIVYRY